VFAGDRGAYCGVDAGLSFSVCGVRCRVFACDCGAYCCVDAGLSFSVCGVRCCVCGVDGGVGGVKGGPSRVEVGA
jgi:hypothetical protein